MAVYLSQALINQTLHTEPKLGKRLVEPLKSFAAEKGFPAKILEAVDLEGEVEVHQTEGDLWQSLGGEVEFICGGEPVNPRFLAQEDGTDNLAEIRAEGIRGGEAYRLNLGEWLWIPPGEPHQLRTKGVARLFIIKLKS